MIKVQPKGMVQKLRKWRPSVKISRRVKAKLETERASSMKAKSRRSVLGRSTVKNKLTVLFYLITGLRFFYWNYKRRWRHFRTTRIYRTTHIYWATLMVRTLLFRFNYWRYAVFQRFGGGKRSLLEPYESSVSSDLSSAISGFSSWSTSSTLLDNILKLKIIIAPT